MHAERLYAIEYMCTKFGVDSSSHFPVGVRTDRHSDASERPTHARGYSNVGKEGPSWCK